MIERNQLPRKLKSRTFQLLMNHSLVMFMHYEYKAHVHKRKCAVVLQRWAHVMTKVYLRFPVRERMSDLDLALHLSVAKQLTNKKPYRALSQVILPSSPSPPSRKPEAVIMAAAIKALNAKIRSNPYTDYFCSTRKSCISPHCDVLGNV